MTKVTHTTTGLCSSIAISSMSGLNPILAIITGVIASLIPDIDTGRSFINKYLIRVKWLRNEWMAIYYAVITASLFLVYQATGFKWLLVLSFLTLLLVIGQHRTFFHSILIMLPLWPLMEYFKLDSEYIALGMINYLNHLVLDMFNPQGVMLFYPISKKVYRMPIVFNSNAFTTRVIEYSFDCFILYMTFMHYVPLLKLS